MGHAAKHLGGVLGLMICLALCDCAGRPSSTVAATPTPQPLTPCVVQTPISAPTFPIAGLQTTVPVPGDPFASLATADGQWLFVSIDAPVGGTASPGIAVLRRAGRAATLAHFLPLSPFPAGEALTHDGRYLIVADYNEIAVVDVAKAEAGQADAVVGVIPTSTTAVTIEVAVSLDDHVIFATNEHETSAPERGDMTVINLQQALAGGLATSGVVGAVPLDYYPVGLALAPDGRHAYVTSRFFVPASSAFTPSASVVAMGSLAVVDVARAERDPHHAVVARALAGCGPVRVVLSPAGDVAWVTAQQSNAVLAFSTAKLVSDPAHALLATVPVGAAPTGIAPVEQGAGLLVACSDRFAGSTAPQAVMLLDTQAALRGEPAVQGSIQEGVFPREIALAGATALVTNFGSQTLSLIDTTMLPRSA